MTAGKKNITRLVVVLAFLFETGNIIAQEQVAVFGKTLHMENVLSGKLKEAVPVKWIQVKFYYAH